MTTTHTIAKYLRMNDDEYVNSGDLDPCPYIDVLPVEVVEIEHGRYGIARVRLEDLVTGDRWWVVGEDELEDIRVLRAA